jgi:hypothetical protein
LNSVEERVSFLEARVEGHSAMINDIRETAARLDARFDQLEARLDQRFAAMDQRFAAIDQRFAVVDSRFLGIDARLDKMSGQLSSLIIGVAVAAISGLLGMITALLR